MQVYHVTLPADSLNADVYDFLKRKAWIEDLHYDGADLVADIQNFRVDYKRYGGKYMNTSTLIRRTLPLIVSVFTACAAAGIQTSNVMKRSRA